MVRRRVERVEIVVDVFDLRTFRDDEPHPAEDRHALVGQHRDRVLVPSLPTPSRQRQVDRVATAGTGRLQPGSGIFDQLLNLSATGIERTAGLTPLLRRNLPHLPGERRKKSVAPEIVDPQLLDRRGIGGFSRPPLHFGERLIDFFYDRIHISPIPESAPRTVRRKRRDSPMYRNKVRLRKTDGPPLKRKPSPLFNGGC